MSKNVIINGVVYSDTPSFRAPLADGPGNAEFFDTTPADAAAGDILAGKTAFNGSGEVAGTMPNNGSVSGDISTKSQTVSVPAGYTSGGTVKISQTEQDKVVSGNIKSGATILGVAGSSTVKDVADTTATAAHVESGYDFYDAGGTKRAGTLTFPTVSQDATTKVLSIS
jgi:hypothetical protein